MDFCVCLAFALITKRKLQKKNLNIAFIGGQIVQVAQLMLFI